MQSKSNAKSIGNISIKKMRETLIEMKIIEKERKVLESDMSQLNYLVNLDKTFDNFSKIYENNKQYGLSYVISLFKIYIKDKKNLFNVDENLVLELIKDNNINKLKFILENLFLQNIDNWVINKFIKQIHTIHDFRIVVDYNKKYPIRNLLCAIIQ